MGLSQKPWASKIASQNKLCHFTPQHFSVILFEDSSDVPMANGYCQVHINTSSQTGQTLSWGQYSVLVHQLQKCLSKVTHLANDWHALFARTQQPPPHSVSSKIQGLNWSITGPPRASQSCSKAAFLSLICLEAPDLVREKVGICLFIKLCYRGIFLCVIVCLCACTIFSKKDQAITLQALPNKITNKQQPKQNGSSIT